MERSLSWFEDNSDYDGDMIDDDDILMIVR